ncbi:MAG: tRNA (guanosine(37)-N1)-methyltransferase TrmD [Candidatus Paceibacterota bacterium]|jgi:tRNA (guanine37-N1)-methyltransferase
MRFHIITIFPDIFSSYLNESIIGRAVKNKLVSVKFYNPRDFIKAPKNNYRPVDDKPYGGGPGMVMRAEPLLSAVAKVLSVAKGKNKKILIINFIPSAEKFTTAFAKKISKKYTDIILICGRYEGIDARVDKILKTKKLSIGDYVLTGGEIPAMILVDCVSRQIPGVLGKYESLEEERVSTSEVYTRPEKLVYKRKSYKVPKVLLSGNHKFIENWKKSSKK